MTDGQFDLAILGGGPGGYVAALYAGARGARVALHDGRRGHRLCAREEPGDAAGEEQGRLRGDRIDWSRPAPFESRLGFVMLRMSVPYQR